MTAADTADDTLRVHQNRAHAHCVVCGRCNDYGLHVEYAPTADGGVEARFDCAKVFQGYNELVHGGVIASLLDGAMTNCLFAHNQPGVTAELTVRFRHPVQTDRPATVRARLTDTCPPLFILRAELEQDDQVKVIARGKFVDRSRVARA